MAAPMTFTANGVVFSESGIAWAGSCPGPGRYYSSDVASGFGPPPTMTSLEYDMRVIAYPGLNGVGTKTFGERGLMITASLIYVGATKAQAEGWIVTDFCTNFPQVARYIVIMPGGSSFGGCKLIQGAASVANWGPSMALPAGGASSVAVIHAAWRQYDVDGFGPNAPSA